ncbi:peptidoglycan-binding protein [Starkeya koreensis]|uniref:Peptidoglycan-binding protein n=1 Tax=Ancylobacter koreensis TaxID=266121 RepID=A0ABT0DP50_9HYPH|nr:peptidoglycan-binding domain-containing protein [Ancylobacter koreensis]MCK0209050.1 peptidoglycan-binding protein [Ancylobacter koreensis]
MPRSYASDLLVDDIDLDGERVAGRPYRSGRRRSDLFMVFVAATASAAVLFNALALQQGRPGSRSTTPAAAPADIRAIPAPQAAAPAPAPAAAAPAAPMQTAPADPLAGLAAAPVATPRPPSRPAAPPKPAASPAPVAAAPVPLTNAPAALLPPGEVPVSPRVMAVQKALSQLGYGPVKVDGKLGAATEEAVRKFESDRRLPVTGQISDRVVREINAVAGLTIQ